MGAAGLHPFVDGFNSQGITKMSQLKCKSIQQINEIATTINMPAPAVERLLDVLGKTANSKKTTTTKKKAAKPKPAKKQPVTNSNITTDAVEEDDDGIVLEEDRRKTDSSYYHFSSTPAEEARKFDAVRVTDPTVAAPQTIVQGASAWNTGSTVEDRDYSEFANNLLKEGLKAFQFSDSIKVKSVTKTAGDFSIVVGRRKIKHIFDLNFSLKWTGKINDTKVSGELEISDIMPDDDWDDWYVQCKSNKNDANHRAAKNIVKGAVERIQAELMQSIISTIRTRAGVDNYVL